MYATDRVFRATEDYAYCFGTSGIIGLGTRPADASEWVGTVSTDHHVHREREIVRGVALRRRDGPQVERVFAPIRFFGCPEKTLIQQPAPKG